MTQRKQPSPLTAPISRLRKLGVTVSYTERHNPVHGFPWPMIGLRVGRPGLRPLVIEREAHRYSEVVDRLTRIADALEEARS